MKRLLLVIVALRLISVADTARAVETNSAPELLAATAQALGNILSVKKDAPRQTLTARIRVLETDSLPSELRNLTVALAYQAPDLLRLKASVNGSDYSLGRNRQELWVYESAKKFGVLGKSGIPKFKANPAKVDTTRLPSFSVSLSADQVALLPLITKVERLPDASIEGTNCHVILVKLLPEARQAFKLPEGELQLTLSETGGLPRKIQYQGNGNVVELDQIQTVEPWPEAKWQPQLPVDQKLEVVPLYSLVKFFQVAISSLGQKIPTLGPVIGQRQLVAQEGEGRLELIDDTRVLFLKGSPEEMGRQQGALLKKEIRNVEEKILYGVGVGSSFEKGKWFFGEIEAAQGRLQPFMNERYLREMDALAMAAGIEPEEIRLANYFPELFHCSGFALFGAATKEGKLYHGRVLDYMRGVGLEPSAVVVVAQPEQANAWVNITYAGFVGSVTAMNSKQIAIGEMGGRGEGRWEGKPMAELVREVMENATTLDDAVRIMKKGPRSCEYYYVISDAKTKRAVGIHATPSQFETILPGQSHPLLPHKMKDAVLMSAGDRYEALTERVQQNYGQFDAESALKLMCRPVAMKSNLHSVLFAPDTLDFWVANADSEKPACDARYTHYNLQELLKPRPQTAHNP